MQKNLSQEIEKAIWAKCLHDLASPLNAMNLGIEEVQTLSPELYDLLASSMQKLSFKIKLWRTLKAGNPQYYHELWPLLRDYVKTENILLNVEHSLENQTTEYTETLLYLALIACDSLPRGGEISILRNQVHGKGKIYLNREVQHFLEDYNLESMNSRQAIIASAFDTAQNMNAKIEFNLDKELLQFTITK